jgi:uncharacterized membrane protein
MDDTPRHGLTLAGHPVHSMVIHYPIALLGVSVLWDAVGIVRTEAVWPDLAFWSLAAGLVFAVPATMTGIVDYSRLALVSAADRIGLYHLTLMLVAAGFFGFSLLIRMWAFKGLSFTVAAACDLFGLILMSVGGWFGGEMVFRHGIGTRFSGARNRAP